MRRKIYRIIFFSILQIVIYIIFNELGWSVGSYLRGVPKHDLSWGITIRFALIVFTTISIIGTIASEFLLAKIKKIHLIVFALSFIIFSLFFVKYYTSVPNKTILLLFSALAGLTTKWLISLRANT